jgi:hypothetical protein
LTFTPTATPTVVATATSSTSNSSQIIIQATVPVVIINNDNSNQNDTASSGSSGSGSSGATGSGNTTANNGSGSFYATTPIPPVGQGGITVFSVTTCGGHYVRVRVYIDENKDRMMSPAEGVDGQAVFCIPQTQYGRTLFIDIPYLQQFGTLQIPESPNEDLEVWFPGESPVLPLFLP